MLGTVSLQAKNKKQTKQLKKLWQFVFMCFFIFVFKCSPQLMTTDLTKNAREPSGEVGHLDQ